MNIGPLEIAIGVGVFIGALAAIASNMKKNNEEKELQKRVDEMTKKREERVKENHSKLDILSNQVSNAINVEIPIFNGFKQNVVENEGTILAKGGDKQLMDLLKVDSFLQDFKNRIENDQVEIEFAFDLEYFKQRVNEESKRQDISKAIEHFHDMAANLEGNKVIGFDAQLHQLFRIGPNLEPALKNQIKTLEFYYNMAQAMLVLYLSDKKIRYFEIYSAFERLGVFDSTWQKNVLNKLGSIESRLISIDNQMTELNQNFKSILDSNESIVNELKELNSAMISNNLLQGITAFQTYRINRKLTS
jgi:hypothetical protein